MDTYVVGCEVDAELGEVGVWTLMWSTHTHSSR